METERLDEETIFAKASLLSDPAKRAEYLEAACGGDGRLRARLERLLHAGQRAARFFARCAAERPDLGEMDQGATAFAPISEKAGDRIGPYKLLQQIGEGGCGVVYMAEQEHPVRRRVALKVIKVGMDTRGVVARFEAERQALALMDHPNIARVLDAGATESGRPYFVMDLVRGIPITDYCDQNNLPASERLELFRQVCQAIQHAHQKGIIHRDIKPSNILVTVNDGVATPKVIDFGIAKATEGRLTDHTLFTAFEQFIGTPAYMSPEQAMMTSLDIDTRSDIYSLGVLLYELLTGKTPFDARELMAAGFDEMRRTIREKEPERPSTRLRTMMEGERATTAQHRRTDAPRLMHLLRGDLDWVVMKCLEKDRTRRYETAAGLATDVERHLRLEPVSARPPSTSYRCKKFVRRNRLAVGAAAAIAVALVLGSVVSAWQAVRATRAQRAAVSAQENEAQQRRKAVAARDQAQEAGQQAMRNLYIANLNLARTDYQEGNILRVRHILEETREHPDRGFEWHYWQRRIRSEIRTFRGHFQLIRDVDLSPDGRLLATASTYPDTKLWDVSSGVELRNFAPGGYAVAFSPDGSLLAVGGTNRVTLWDVHRQRVTAEFFPSNSVMVTGLGFSPDGERLVVSAWDQVNVSVWRVAQPEKLFDLVDEPTGMNRACFSPDGALIYTAGKTGIARLWDARDGRLIHRLDAKAGMIWGGGFSPDGKRLVTPHWADETARVWETASGRELMRLPGHTDSVTSAIYSPDGSRIYTAGFDRQIKVWDARTGRALGALPKGHVYAINALAVSKDGRSLASVAWDGQVKLWDTQILDEPRTLQAPLWDENRSHWSRFMGALRGCITFLAADSTNGLILAGDSNFCVRVWDFATFRPLHVLAGHQARLSALAASPDLQRVISADQDGAVSVWKSTTGQRIASLQGHTNKTIAVQFSADGRKFMTADANGSVILWSGLDQVVTRIASRLNPFCTALSPDARKLAASGHGDWLAVWNAETGEELRRDKVKSNIMSLGWSPDGSKLACGTFSGRIEIRDAASGAVLVEAHGHHSPVWAVSYSPDASRLVSGSLDRTARVWGTASGRELLTLSGHSEDVHSAIFAPNGRAIVTGSDDQTMRVWEAASPQQAAQWQKEEDEASVRLGRLRQEFDSTR